MKNAVMLTLKVILLIVIMVMSLAVSSVIMGVHSSSGTSSSGVLSVIIYASMNTIILSIFIQLKQNTPSLH